jgi:hypothetical protein
MVKCGSGPLSAWTRSKPIISFDGIGGMTVEVLYGPPERNNVFFSPDTKLVLGRNEQNLGFYIF